ncbi:MAG: AtpZ/AtpI family protein [Bacteroidota bacterium]
MSLQDQQNEKNQNKLSARFSESGTFLTAGLQLSAAVILMALLGWWLDERWNTKPWLTFVGALFGSGAGLYQFIKTVNKVSKEEEKKEQFHW